MKLLVIGDSCIDIFRYGTVNRLAPEAPIPIINPKTENSNPGMAGNVVANLKALGAKVDFITNKTEIHKIRYICSKYNHLLLRVDENDNCESFDINKINEISNKKYDALIISDYCKGFLDKLAIKKISTYFKCPIFLDTKKILGDYTNKINFIKINFQEFKNNESQIDIDKNLYNKLIVTRGKYGCDYQNKNYPTTEVPVKDISGAGDSFLAGLVVEYVKTNNIEKAINFAQKCTTIVVQKPGVSTI